MPHTRKEILQWGQHMADRILHRKHQEPEEVTIRGWVARDRNGSLCIYTATPNRNMKQGCWYGSGCTPLFQEDFPSVQWSDFGPTQATITIKIEK